MRMKTGLTALYLSVLIPTTSNAFSNAVTWSYGWGQGMSEFIIQGKGLSQLYLACDDGGARPAPLIFTDTTGHDLSMDNEKTLQLRIDGGEAIDISESDSRGRRKQSHTGLECPANR